MVVGAEARNGGHKRLRQISGHLRATTPAAATARSGVRCRATLAAASAQEEEEYLPRRIRAENFAQVLRWDWHCLRWH